MKLVKIKNRYLFNSNNPNGTYTYALYKDRKTKELRAVALTHIYNKDPNRFNQIRRGNIIVEKFKEFDVPSGVHKHYYSTDINGNKLNLKNNNIEKLFNSYVNKKQSKRIINFADRRYERGREVLI